MCLRILWAQACLTADVLGDGQFADKWHNCALHLKYVLRHFFLKLARTEKMLIEAEGSVSEIPS